MSEVFISYSRRNTEFVRHLFTRLFAANKTSWIDWEDIPLTAPNWWNEIKAGIEQAENFLFVMSFASMSSIVCNMELDYAFELHKRIIPVVYQDVDIKVVSATITNFEPDEAMEERLAGKDPILLARNNWRRLSHINWIHFQNDNQFDAMFEQLMSAIETDLVHVKTHTRLLERSIEWEANVKRIALLLTGEEVATAENWLQQSDGSRPEPTKLQREYILESRRIESIRAHNRSAVRHQRVFIVVQMFLLMLSIFAVGLMIYRIVNGSVDERLNNDLSTSAYMASNGVREIEREYFASVRILASTEGLNTAIGKNDSVRLEALVTPVVVNNHIDIVIIFDGSYLPVFASRYTSPGDDMSGNTSLEMTTNWIKHIEVLQTQLKGTRENITSIINNPNGAFFYFAERITNERGVIVGAVALGLSSSDFVKQLSERTTASIAIYDNSGNIIAANSFPDYVSTQLSNMEPLSVLGNSFQGNYISDRTVNDLMFRFLYTPFILRGESSGVLGVALPINFITEWASTSRNSLIFAAISAGVMFTILNMAGLRLGRQKELV